MASFNNINGPSNKPMIQESQNMQNNGGGGNLGYFQRQQEENFKPKDMVDMFEKEDSFESDKNKDEGFFGRIAGFFKKLFAVFAHIFKGISAKLFGFKNFSKPKQTKTIEKDQFLTLSRNPNDNR